jgi:hypothetical protein
VRFAKIELERERGIYFTPKRQMFFRQVSRM